MADIYDAIGLLRGWGNNFEAVGDDDAAYAMQLAAKIMYDFAEDPSSYAKLERQMEARFRGSDESGQITAVEASAELSEIFRNDYFEGASYEEIKALPDDAKLEVFDRLVSAEWT